MTYVLVPHPGLLAKLASALVHADEYLESCDSGDVNGAHFDLQAFRSTIADPEVQEWIKEMTRLAFAPVKRKIAGKAPSGAELLSPPLPSASAVDPPRAPRARPARAAKNPAR